MIINNLAVGDIFHAECPNRARLICLATSVIETTIRARSVTNDPYFEFDRQTGTGIVTWRDRKSPCAIYSTLPLPKDIHDAILEIDRKARLAEDRKPRSAEDESQPWLSDDERRALLYVAKHYSSKRP
jgi:hypothetical protein